LQKILLAICVTPRLIEQWFQTFSDHVPFLSPVLSPRTTLKTPCSRKTHSILSIIRSKVRQTRLDTNAALTK